MNILSINKFYWRKGGSEAVFFGEKKLLEDQGHVVVPFSMKMKQNIYSNYSKYFIEEVDYEDKRFLSRVSAATKVVYSVEAKRKIKLLLNEFTPDIAHFHIFQHQISPSVFYPLRKKNVPLVLTLHDLKPMCPNYKMYIHNRICEKCIHGDYYHAFFNACVDGSRIKSLVNVVEMYCHKALQIYKNVDKFIAVSKFYRDKMIEAGFDRKQIAYIPNYVDINEYSPGYFDAGYALFFGRLSSEKGVIDLLDAAKNCPSIPFKIAGDGPEKNALQSYVIANGIENIEFMGFKTGEELKELVQLASFVVVPSVWYENCPMSILESFSLSTPVIGARIGGIPELIEEGETGYTFRAHDINDLVSKIEDLWSSEDLREYMGRLARQRVIRDFSPMSHYEKLIGVYKSVLNQ